MKQLVFMNKLNIYILLLLLLVTINRKADAQVYYNGKKLGTSRIQGERIGNLLGAYVTIGLSPANTSKVIEGKQAELVIKDKRPQFIIKFESKNDRIYMKSENIEYIVLVSLQKKSSSRRLRTGKYGLIAGIQTNISEKEFVPISIEESEENSGTYLVKPKEKLKKGEYAFYYIRDDIEPKNVYDFCVK